MTAFVYRVYDERGELLYIGSTGDFDARKAIHMATRNNPVALPIQLYAKRWETEEHPDIASARAAEKAAIEAEAPYLNRHWNPKRWRRAGNEWVPLTPLYEPPKREPNKELLAVLGAMFPGVPADRPWAAWDDA